MGNFILKMIDSLSSSSPTKILILGLDGAGKTTIMYKLKLNETVMSVPTIGFNMEQLQYKNLKFNCWDIGGQSKIRSLWKHYYENTDCVIFVLDASDEERLELAKETIFGLIREDELKNCPVLVFANKMDMANIGVAEIAKRLGLDEMRVEWNI